MKSISDIVNEKLKVNGYCLKAKVYYSRSGKTEIDKYMKYYYISVDLNNLYKPEYNKDKISFNEARRIMRIVRESVLLYGMS